MGRVPHQRGPVETEEPQLSLWVETLRDAVSFGQLILSFTLPREWHIPSAIDIYEMRKVLSPLVLDEKLCGAEPCHCPPRREQEWIKWMLKLTPQVEGQSLHRVNSCTLGKFLSLPSKWHWLAGRHSQRSMNIDTDKECICEVTNCIHWDKGLRKTGFVLAVP